MKTIRGFELQYFEDDYGKECSIQESSAYEPHIWLGVHKPEIRIMYKDAVANGILVQKKYPETNECGWCDLPIPNEAMIDSRMHLSRKQAKDLAAKLNYFAKHGHLREET